MSKTCIKCNVEKLLNEFQKDKQKKDGLSPYCKECRNSQKIEYFKTFSGCIARLLSGARKRANERSEKTNRNDNSGEFTITTDDLINIWNNQNGLCYYSTLPMTFDGAWKLSLERLDNTKGYTLTNTVFCCLEFNTRQQWTNEKITEMIKILDENIELNLVNFELNEKSKIQNKRQIQIINNIKYYKCYECDEFKKLEELKKNQFNLCKSCHNILNKEYENTPRGSLKRLVASSKKTTKHRESINNDNRDTSHDITYEYLIEIFNKQHGLCAISKLPIQFGNTNDTNWTCSLERIDVFKGYIEGNICLICNEFQATDHSVRMKEKPETSTSWTREKFLSFEQSVRNRLLINI
jgi:hypothetical protein